VAHSGSVGTSQKVFGALEVTQVEYPTMMDLDTLAPALAAEAQKSLLTSVMSPEGRKFKPTSNVARAEFAEAIVRGGFVPQYVGSAPMFTDVRDLYSRGTIESVQANPNGALIVDAAGGRFYPYSSTTKLIAAIAYVKAAGLESLTASATLPLMVTDTASIPAQWRGYVAVALERGFIRLDGSAFNSSRPITRIELAQSLNELIDE
jgi:hypothetical protein